MDRSSGIILPVYALPSPYGIGTLGQAARDFVDFLVEAGQTWWQMLPVGPTSFGDSPYQSPSTFAGNPYYVDLDLLIADELLTKAEVASASWGADPARVDYQALFRERTRMLRRAYRRGWERDAEKVAAFAQENAVWLEDYALFEACKAHFDLKPWSAWPDDDLRMRRPEALAAYRAQLEDDVNFAIYVQYLFYTQWESLFAYAHRQGIKLIGDLPIYVAFDSSDVWANPELFMLDERNMPIEVAGVPPDSFTADGQLWGNPLYDYEAMEADGFCWWIKRVAGAARLYDMIRIDHFRGFESFWAVPADAKTAKRGRWVKGPGMKLVGTLQRWFPQLSFIAEDLGYTTPEVAQLLSDSGLPGMKVLEFAFDSRDCGGNAYRPHTYGPHCVCYIGTHDNATIVQWREDAGRADVDLATRYLGLNDDEGFAWGFVRGGMGSVADLFVAQMQDYLELGADARTNVPGTLGENWRWRLVGGQATPELAARIAAMTTMYGRSTR